MITLGKWYGMADKVHQTTDRSPIKRSRELLVSRRFAK